jgi:hypothetical protein
MECPRHKNHYNNNACALPATIETGSFSRSGDVLNLASLDFAQWRGTLVQFTSGGVAMRLWLLIALACSGAPIFAQEVSPSTQPIPADQAMQRLRERQAQRESARSQKVTITRGELDDLKTEIAALKAELTAIKAAAAQAPPANGDPQPRYVLRIATGTTRPQLITFLAMHKERYRIGKDVRNPDKQELITIERYKTEKVFQGYGTNGVNQVKEYKTEKTVVASWELVLIGDLITEISGGDAGEID